MMGWVKQLWCQWFGHRPNKPMAHLLDERQFNSPLVLETSRTCLRCSAVSFIKQPEFTFTPGEIVELKERWYERPYMVEAGK